MKRTTLITAALAVAAGMSALAAAAQQQSGTALPVEDRMSVAEIAAMLEGQGYKIREIELERGRYDVEMIDSRGMRVEAYLNPVTGAVLPYRHDDDDRDHDRYDD